MTSHPLLACEEIACETLFVRKDAMNDEISVRLAEWAGTSFDRDPEAENVDFYASEKIFFHEPVMRLVINRIQRMALKENITMEKIVMATFKQNLGPVANRTEEEKTCFGQIKQTVNEYLSSLAKEITAYSVYSKDPQHKQILEDAKIRKIENRFLVLSLECTDSAQFLPLSQKARDCDNKLFSNKTMGAMDHAMNCNYVPYGYRQRYL